MVSISSLASKPFTGEGAQFGSGTKSGFPFTASHLARYVAAEGLLLDPLQQGHLHEVGWVCVSWGSRAVGYPHSDIQRKGGGGGREKRMKDVVDTGEKAASLGLNGRKPYLFPKIHDCLEARR